MGCYPFTREGCMEILQFLFWWSLIGILPYQFFVLRPWVKTHHDELWLSDIVKSLPFGLIVIMASFFINMYNVDKIKRK